MFDAIDLGLSVSWASCNYGATEESETGDLYAWGELAPYYNEGYANQDHLYAWKDGKEAGYLWPSYSFDNSPGKDASSFSKYTGSDYATLQAVDDVANTTLHGFWRIPTKEDWAVLADATKFNWNWDSSCAIVSSKDPDYADVKMVLPSAGAWGGRFYGNTDGNHHYVGSYWSSSLMTAAPWGAYMMYFVSDGTVAMTSSLRCYGFSIRPVTD